MSMKPTLALRLGQQLRMTPQLQQAIKLLQLSTLDLQQEIQEALDSNLMLEEIDDSHDDVKDETPQLEPPTSSAEENANAEVNPVKAEDTNPQTADEPVETHNSETDGDLVSDTSEELTSEVLTDDLPIDSVWEDIYDQLPIGSGETYYNNEGEDDFESRNSSGETIHSHLMEQINLLNLTDQDLFIAHHLVDGLNEEGMLELDLLEILESAPPQWGLELDQIEAVLHLIQHLDPLGIAAANLQECLLIQLKALPESTPMKSDAIVIVNEYITSLASRDFTLLSKKAHLTETELQAVIKLIQSLNPKPGAGFTAREVQYVIPDVMVRKINGRWTVELNPTINPRIRVNPEYSALIKRSDNSPDQHYLKDQMQEAKWFIKSLQQRNDTLLRVATKIVEVQRGFLEHGEEAMKPLVLHDIAEEVGLHESTISRVTTQKYIDTPLGVFELKYFFSSHVSTNSGGEVSSTAIRALIKRLIADESVRKPLSDSKIANLLSQKNVKVARRTIAKYRESLMIPPSNERKQLV